MKAGIVRIRGEAPVYGDFEAPSPLGGEQRITMRAAALTPLTKMRAQGRHYSASTEVPFVVGVDGVGTLDDGQRVYMLMPRAPFGAMAEQCVVDARHCVPLDERIDDIHAAALAIPGMSSWVPLKLRTGFTAGQTVLVHGATGASGMLAVQIAKHLGAQKVIATGRNAQALDGLLGLGADVTVSLLQSDEGLMAALEPHMRAGVDVVLDYLWGPSMEVVLKAAARYSKALQPVRVVQIGTASAAEIQLEGTLLRSCAIELVGSGFGSVSMQDILTCIRDLLRSDAVAKFKLPVSLQPLADIQDAFAAREPLPRRVISVNVNSNC